MSALAPLKLEDFGHFLTHHAKKSSVILLLIDTGLPSSYTDSIVPSNLILLLAIFWSADRALRAKIYQI